MSTPFLCVQFRNLLPSEQLLLFARTQWSALQAGGGLASARDATLLITYTDSEIARFTVELSVQGGLRRVRAHHADALLAIQQVFALCTARSPRTAWTAPSLLGTDAPASSREWHSDTSST